MLAPFLFFVAYHFYLFLQLDTFVKLVNATGNINIIEMEHNNKIGRKIKTLREFRKITNNDLSLSANLGVSQLEEIERKGNVPSLGHLIKISRALGVRLGTFLDDQEQIGPVLVRSGGEQQTRSFSTNDEKNRQHLNFFSLAPNKSDKHMEPFIVDIEPRKLPDYKLSTHEGEEFIFVMKGKIEINYGKDIYELDEGDSIYLDSVVAHNIHAAGNRAAKILAVIYTPL